MKKTILITGASGSMGSEVLKQIAETGKYSITIILRTKKVNIRLAKSLQKKISGYFKNYFRRLINLCRLRKSRRKCRLYNPLCSDNSSRNRPQSRCRLQIKLFGHLKFDKCRKKNAPKRQNKIYSYRNGRPIREQNI